MECVSRRLDRRASPWNGVNSGALLAVDEQTVPFRDRHCQTASGRVILATVDNCVKVDKLWADVTSD